MEINSKKKTILKLCCKRCNTVFSIKGYNYLRAVTEKSEKNLIKGTTEHFFPFCCPTCLSNFKKNNVMRPSGSNHPQWKGGVNPEKRDGYVNTLYNRWRRGIFTVYKGKCFLTGLKDRLLLRAHHLDSWFTAPEKRYEISNGVLLAEKIHVQFHNLFGDHTTKEHFEQFCRENYNVNLFPWGSSKELMDNIQERIKTEPEKAQQEIEKKIIERNFQLITGKYENKNSKFTIFCPKHNIFHETSAHNFKRTVFGLPCCALESLKKTLPPSQLRLTRSPETIAKRLASIDKTILEKKLSQLAKKRFHEILEGTFENQKSLFKIRCTVHNKEFNISYANYCRSKSGLNCCSNRPKELFLSF